MKKIGILMVLAIAMLSVSAMADGRWDKDVLGIIETEESTLKFPTAQDTNIDLLEVGNDKALAIGRGADPIATNNLEIKKNQDSGKCGDCCDPYTRIYNATPVPPALELESHDCKDCCIKVNVDQIKVGDRNALAFGPGSEATNNVKIVADQR